MIRRLPDTNFYLHSLAPTPLAAVALAPHETPIWCKLEFLNPSGSTKDRIARFILGKAWREGRLQPGDTVVEASSGSTSIAMALTCAQLGLKFIAAMPEGVSNERVFMIRAYGGAVRFTPKAGGIQGAIAEAERLADEENCFLPRQFHNLENAAAHAATTAREIAEQIPGGAVDAVVSGVGTGGTLVGIYQGLRETGSPVRPVLARPIQLDGTSEVECCSFSTRIPGVVDSVSTIFKPAEMPDLQTIEVQDEDAIQTTRQLIARGFPVGPSSGLNFFAAQSIARHLGPAARVVTVFADRMERYFTTELFAPYNTRMQRRAFLRAALAAPALLAAAPRPNIILIMADDLGFSDIGPYGSEIATPTLDALARNGLRFSQFYNTARCCPTRACLMTGLYPHQAGIGHMMNDYGSPGYKGDLNKTSVTIAEVLRTAGYRTAMCGKWHVTPQTADNHNWPLQRGFEKYYGTIAGAGSFWDPATLTRDNTPIKPDKPNFYYTDELGTNAANYIDELTGKGAPLFLYVAFTAPHWPMHAPESTIAKYKDRYKAGWDALRVERHARQKRMGVVKSKWELSPRAPEVPAWDDIPNKDWHIRRMAVYAAMIDHVDQNIGKIVAKLKQKNQLDNTLIFFLADNGGCAEGMGPRNQNDGNPNTSTRPLTTRDGREVKIGNDPKVMPGPDDTYQSYGPEWAHASNTPFRLYKHFVHEGGISSPLIIHWPKAVKNKNTFTDQPGHLIDIMATCVDVAGAKYPAEYNGNKITPLEGKPLTPIIEGKQRPGHEAIYWEHEGNQAIRMANWKLVKRHGTEWELYDIDNDRTELNNLAAKDPARVKAMAAKWDAWAKRANVLPWQSWLPAQGAKKKKKA